jgi:hypothetical protein
MPWLSGGSRGKVAHNKPLLRRAGLGPFSKRLVVDNFSKSFEIPSVPFTKHPVPMPLGWLIHPQILRKRLISDGSMWKGPGTVLLELAASFGLAILNAFEMPIAYLKAGIEWCVAWLLKGLSKVSGMFKLMGFESQDVNTNFGDKDLNKTVGKLGGKPQAAFG